MPGNDASIPASDAGTDADASSPASDAGADADASGPTADAAVGPKTPYPGQRWTPPDPTYGDGGLCTDPLLDYVEQGTNAPYFVAN